MSWNNITPWWLLCNPFRIPSDPPDTWYYVSPMFKERQGPVGDYSRACDYLIAEGGKVVGKKEWCQD